MGLPRELRDMVYTNVFSSTRSKSGSTTRLLELDCGDERPTTVKFNTICFDWLDLMRTNGIVADEMRDLYHMQSCYTSAADRTWSMLLNLNNDEYTLEWTSLPCPSFCVRHLSIDFIIDLTLSKFGHWDSDRKDKFGNTFTTLIELLTRIAQHGPNITVSETLRRPVVFETLSLNISFADEEKPYLISSGPESIYILGYGKRRIYNHLIEDMVTAFGTHMLQDKVKSIRVQGPKNLGLPRTDITTA